jgi:hypothetical protein
MCDACAGGVECDLGGDRDGLGGDVKWTECVWKDWTTTILWTKQILCSAIFTRPENVAVGWTKQAYTRSIRLRQEDGAYVTFPRSSELRKFLSLVQSALQFSLRIWAPKERTGDVGVGDNSVVCSGSGRQSSFGCAQFWYALRVGFGKERRHGQDL